VGCKAVGSKGGPQLSQEEFNSSCGGTLPPAAQRGDSPLTTHPWVIFFFFNLQEGRASARLRRQMPVTTSLKVRRRRDLQGLKSDGGEVRSGQLAYPTWAAHTTNCLDLLADGAGRCEGSGQADQGMRGPLHYIHYCCATAHLRTEWGTTCRVTSSLNKLRPTHRHTFKINLWSQPAYFSLNKLRSTH
jgi:hypothetical protein